MSDPLTHDHTEIYDTLVARRYFAKFETILSYLPRVAAELETDKRLTRPQTRAIAARLEALQRSFRALSLKYLMTGRDEAFTGRLVFDRHEGGFPVANELLFMANDAAQAAAHLAGMPSETEIKDQMIRQIVGDQVLPTRLQFALSQRLYHQMLVGGGLFWPRNDVRGLWLSETRGRTLWLLEWAVYDTLLNLPVIYLMEVEDSGSTPLLKDERRWPRAQAHLMAQSINGLKLLTIAQGFDTDFDDLHPKSLKRLHIGPMYSASFTLQSGAIGEILSEARAPQGKDWALVWTLEDLLSERTEQQKSGWFSTVERQVFALDPFGGAKADSGATRTEQFVILPEIPYQMLAERNPPGFRAVTRFVVGAGGRVIKAQ